ncbi:DNA-binding response regulator MtrA [Cutibacterium acnes JCM 18920]|nr:DNA-binding response regulator MtrA [Cutibacterium acnes JCM 18920]
MREVWGYTNVTDTRLVNVHVQRLRSKVERNADHPQMIVTVRGIGYRINTPGEES